MNLLLVFYALIMNTHRLLYFIFKSLFLPVVAFCSFLRGNLATNQKWSHNYCKASLSVLKSSKCYIVFL